MRDSENKRNLLPFWRYFILVSFFVALAALPYVLAPYNDRALKASYAAFPNSDNVQSFVAGRLVNSIKRDFYLIFGSDKSSYQMYEPVEFRLALVDKKNAKSWSNLRPVLSVTSPEGTPVLDIFDRAEVPLSYDRETHTYKAVWHPSAPLSGDYSAAVSVTNEAFSSPIEEQISLVFSAPSAPPELKTAYSIIGLDSKELLSQRSILSVSNREAAIGALTEWMPFLNVDGVLLQGAVSKTYGVKNEIWDEAKLSESEALAKTLAAENVQPLLMVQMMELDGIEISRLGYTETKYEGSSPVYRDRSIVSLGDAKRADDLIQVLTRFQKNGNVSSIALSKFFYEASYHNELYSLFTNQNPFLAGKGSSAFQKWKRFFAVGYLRNLLKAVPGTKPYVALFSSDEIKTHPEFLDMAFAAGVQYAILDFQGTPKQSEEILSGLFSKTFPHRSRLILSYQIDFNDYVNETESSLEAWKSSFLSALSRYGFRGLYINDLYKAMFGKRGPYPAYEWMLSAASLVSDWKFQSGLSPLSIQMIPSTQSLDTQFHISFVIKNQSREPLSNLSLNLLPTIDLTALNPRLLSVAVLKPGESLMTNILLTNVGYRQLVLQKRTSFLALHAKFTSSHEFNYTALLPFVDATVDPDRPYQSSVMTNKAIELRAAPPAEPAKPREQQSAPPAPRPAQVPPAQTPAVRPPAPRVTPPAVETQKLSYVERRRLEREQRQKEKEAAKAAREAEKKS